MQKPTIESLPVKNPKALPPNITRQPRRSSNELQKQIDNIDDEIKDDESGEQADCLPSVYVLNTNSNSKTFVANESAKKSLPVNSL